MLREAAGSRLSAHVPDPSPYSSDIVTVGAEAVSKKFPASTVSQSPTILCSLRLIVSTCLYTAVAVLR